MQWTCISTMTKKRSRSDQARANWINHCALWTIMLAKSVLAKQCSSLGNVCSQVNVDNDSRLFRVGWLVARANHISCGPFTDWPCSIITPSPFQSLCACVFTTDKWSNCFELQFHEIGWPNYRHLHAALHWHGPIGECHNWEEQHKQWEEMNKDDTPLLQFSSV